MLGFCVFVPPDPLVDQHVDADGRTCIDEALGEIPEVLAKYY